MIDLMTVIQSLRPNAELVVRGDEIEWHDTTQTQPTDSEITAELTRLQAEYDNNQYQRDRQYASTGDQLDMLWHAIDEGGTLDKTSEFYIANKAVKDANPKP
jgi:hypothetical protein